MNRKNRFVNKRLVAGLCAGAIGFGTLVGCSSDADVVSENLSKAAEQFEVNRRFTVINGITDSYLMTIEGRCSVEFPDDRTELVCRLQDGTFIKNFYKDSDNIFIFIEQINGTTADTDQYRVIFKPESLVPNVDRP